MYVRVSLLQKPCLDAYLFTFFLSAHEGGCNGEVTATVDFLDDNYTAISNSAIYVLIQRGSLNERYVWVAYINNAVAPECAQTVGL